MPTPTMRGPKDVAREVSAKGRTIDAKRVRAWVRENIAAFDDDGYTAHLYNADTYRRIVVGLTTATKTARSRAASTGRSGAVKPAATVKPRSTGTRKAGRVMGSGPIAAGPAEPVAS